jgi:orotidine-5'-phosphate decarboxylase
MKSGITRRDKPVIVALDFPDAKSSLELLGKLDPALCRAKVGKELFTRGGPELVRSIMAEGFEVFLDLKFHDIPNTVAGAVAAAAELGVWMVNVHASGGRAMLQAAHAAVRDSSTLLTAVTVLTSLSEDDLQEVGFSDAPEALVLRLARLAGDCEIDGVVCSAREIALLRSHLPSNFLLVTPGIRPAGDSVGDQKRIATPAAAIADGGDYLVIGRPITQAPDPQRKLQDILAEIHGRN